MKTKSTLEKRPGRVIFTRPGPTPARLEGIYHLALLATGLCSPLMLVVEPLHGAMAAGGFGAVAMTTGLLFMGSRFAFGGRLLQVRKHFELVSPTSADGYRDAPREEMLEVERRRFPKSKVREVVLGHFVTTSNHHRYEHWPVYLVLDAQAIALAVLRDEVAARTLSAEVAELFDVPMRSRETMVFGVGLGAGCLNGVVTIGLDLLFVLLPLLALSMLGPYVAVPTAALTALLLWLNHRFTPRIFAADIRRGIDEQVVRVFELDPSEQEALG